MSVGTENLLLNCKNGDIRFLRNAKKPSAILRKFVTENTTIHTAFAVEISNVSIFCFICTFLWRQMNEAPQYKLDPTLKTTCNYSSRFWMEFEFLFRII